LDIELSVGAGTLAIVGPNGAGKSTLLRCLLGAHPVLEGRVIADGAVLCDTATKRSLPVEERRLAYVPQNCALFPNMTARQNLEFARSCQREGPPSSVIDALMDDLGILSLSDRRAPALSGGERQRVALARALVQRPRALLLDEPTAALDAQSRQQVRDHLSRHLRALGIPTLLVTHDEQEARQLATDVMVLDAGKVIERGTWSRAFGSGTPAFVRGTARGGDAT